jgi:hypothetical protein
MAGTTPLTDAAYLAIEAVLKTKPAAMMIMWENEKGELLSRCLPASQTLARGFMERIYAAMNAAANPTTDVEDDEE